jgi:carboxypeptidase D
MLNRNKQATEAWDLKGLLIGNGWISGEHQYPAYLKYAYHHGLLTEGGQAAQIVEKKHASCIQQLSGPGIDHVSNSECENVLADILYYSSITVNNDQRQCYNMFDVRRKDEYPACGASWPPEVGSLLPYLRRTDVMAALHVEDKQQLVQWEECSGAVGAAFKSRSSKPSVNLLPDLLKEVPILLYSGDQDLTINHFGTEDLIDSLQWNGAQGFGDAPRLNWTFDSEAAGYYQMARNLTYVHFYNASQMVPYDQPLRSRAMLDRFMGVDVSGIGGEPVKSIVGGDSGSRTSVGALPNKTELGQEEDDKIAAAVRVAKWDAYKRAGTVALVTVLFLAAAAWGFLKCSAARRNAGYKTVLSGESEQDIQTNYKDAKDLEAADFDEHELDDLASSDDEGIAELTPSARLSDEAESSERAETRRLVGKK